MRDLKYGDIVFVEKENKIGTICDIKKNNKTGTYYYCVEYDDDFVYGLTICDLKLIEDK